MSFFNMYLIAGGTGSADINAGTSVGAAQAAATTNGNWNSGTGVFIAASGTPFAATIVGDYASVYVDGATVTTFVGKVLTVTSNVNITIDVATLKYGTAPSTSATARSCVINGSWNTEQVLAAGGLASTTVPQSTKINIKGNLTITTNRTISMAGATTAPLWFSGYTTNPGDQDADTANSLTKPIWTLNATFGVTLSGLHQLWSGLSFVGNISGAVVTQNVTGGWTMVRCRVENTSSNAAAVALSTTAQTHRYLYCYFKCPTTATTTGVFRGGARVSCLGCVFEGGGIAGYNGTTVADATITGCVFLNNTGAGMLFSTGSAYIYGNTVYGATADGIKWTSTPGQAAHVIGNLFSGLNGSTATTNGINNASGTNTNMIVRACNDYYNVTNAEVGFGDSPAFFPQTDSSPVVTSATDMTPVALSNARNNGFPGKFEAQSFVSYPDIGAVDHIDPSGGGYAGGVFSG